MAYKKPIHGVQTNHEVKPSTEFRDIRTLSEKLKGYAEAPGSALMLSAVLIGSIIMFPNFAEILFLIGFFSLRWMGKQEIHLPFRMPKTSGALDHSDPVPGDEAKSSIANGISFLGNDLATKKELWFKSDDLRTHLLVFGSTGAGKALRASERILTPSGWRPLNKLVEGDIIFTSKGGIQRIEGIYPQGEKNLFELTMDDGRTLTACGEHLWEVVDENGIPKVISTLEVMEEIKTGTLQLPLPCPMELEPYKGSIMDVAVTLTRRLRVGESLPQATYGSIQQRESLFKVFSREFSSISDKTKTIFQFNNYSSALWVAELSRSLGYWAKPEKTEKGATVTVLTNKQGGAVVSVIDLQRSEECICIEVSDPSGLFIAGSHVVTHNTETLISFAFNSLVHASGFIYVDGKGDNTLFAKIYSICRSMGRDTDLLCINYMTGGQDIFGPKENKLSNTMNPFSKGSGSGLTELLVGLMDDGGGDSGMWKGRAITLISGLMFALVYMRENENFLLDVDQIRDYMILENIEKLAKRRELPTNVLASLRAYLKSLPGYQADVSANPNGKQSDTVYDQHGFLQMQFTRILGSLSDTYGYIFRTNLGEVDFQDVVLQRRIMVVLLPALEKSQDELGNLGKIILASLKQMMAVGLGDRLEGDFADVISNKPTNSKAPFTCILDEYGYYVVKGAAVMPAQARSLGFTMVFAGQDYPAFKKGGNQEEAVSTIGNCNIKIFMKVEDPTDTFELFTKSIGEAVVSKTSGFSYEQGLINQTYMDQRNVSLSKINRGDSRDLKNQLPGEAHILFKDTVVRAKMFYVNPQDAKSLRLNHFLRVAPPKLSAMEALDSKTKDLTERLNNTEVLNDWVKGLTLNPRLKVATQAMINALKESGDVDLSIQTSIGAAYKMSYASLDSMSKEVQQAAETPKAPTINLFSSKLNEKSSTEEEDDDYANPEEEEQEEEEENSDEGDSSDASDDNEDEHGPHNPHGEYTDDKTFINRTNTLKSLFDMGKELGKSKEEALSSAKQVIQEFEKVTDYPNPDNTLSQPNPDAIIGIIQEIGSGINDSK